MGDSFLFGVCTGVSVSPLCILIVKAHSHSFSTFGLVFVLILQAKFFQR